MDSLSQSPDPLEDLSLSEALYECLRPSYEVVTDEAELQGEIAERLQDQLFNFFGEYELPGGRIDFVVMSKDQNECIGVEVKVDGSLADVTRQLQRYAKGGGVTSILLVTCRNIHVRVPKELDGVPIRVLWLSPL